MEHADQELTKFCGQYQNMSVWSNRPTFFEKTIDYTIIDYVGIGHDVISS